MKQTIKQILVLALALVASLSMVRAEVGLADIFGSNMVLQRESNVRIWGKSDTAKSNIKVTTSWNKKAYSTVADSEGRWEVSVATSTAQRPSLSATVEYAFLSHEVVTLMLLLAVSLLPQMRTLLSLWSTILLPKMSAKPTSARTIERDATRARATTKICLTVCFIVVLGFGFFYCDLSHKRSIGGDTQSSPDGSYHFTNAFCVAS